MLENVMNVLTKIGPIVVGVMLGAYVGYSEGETAGYKKGIDDLLKHIVKVEPTEPYKEFLKMTQRMAAGVEGKVTVPVYVGDEKIDEIIKGEEKRDYEAPETKRVIKRPSKCQLYNCIAPCCQAQADWCNEDPYKSPYYERGDEVAPVQQDKKD